MLLQNSSFWNIRRFRLYDWLTVAYLALWIILILLFYRHIPRRTVFLVAHFLSLLFALFMAGLHPRVKLLSIIQRWYPVFYLPLFFNVLHYMIPAIHPVNFDRFLVAADKWLIGGYPTLWFEHIYHPLLSDIFQLCYSLFYFLPLFILIPLQIQNKDQQFERAGAIFLLLFYVSYLGYVLFPALGPRYYLAHLHTRMIPGHTFYRVIHHTLNNLESIQWDAFPSGHIAVALGFSYFAFLFYRRLFWASLPVIFSLFMATLYFRYHYLVDLIAGTALFLFAVFIDRLWFAPIKNREYLNKSHT